MCKKTSIRASFAWNQGQTLIKHEIMLIFKDNNFLTRSQDGWRVGKNRTICALILSAIWNMLKSLAINVLEAKTFGFCSNKRETEVRGVENETHGLTSSFKVPSAQNFSCNHALKDTWAPVLTLMDDSYR